MKLEYHVEPHSVLPGHGRLVLRCGDNNPEGHCRFSLAPQRNEAQQTWEWDGSVDQPTINPSINCHGGCGRHFTMVRGQPT